jgi:hypothetical protein
MEARNPTPKDRSPKSPANFASEVSTSGDYKDDIVSTYADFTLRIGFEPDLYSTGEEFKDYLKKSEDQKFFQLLELFNSPQITALGKQRLIIRIENEINATAPIKAKNVEQLAANKKLHAEKIKIFQAEVNSAFGFPSDNPWQNTLAGITQVSAVVSANNKREKVRDEDATTLNYTATTSKLHTASYVAKKADGTQVIAVVSGSKDADVSRIAADTCRAMAQYSSHYSLDQNSQQIGDIASGQEHNLEKDSSIASASYLYISHASEGTFTLTGGLTGNATVIVFDPNSTEKNEYKFSTLVKPSQSEQKGAWVVKTDVDEALSEDSIVLCLTGETLKYLPTKQDTGEINFAKLFKEDFELPSNLNESTLMNALANHAAKNHLLAVKLNADNQLPPEFQDRLIPPQQVFIVGLSLSNELKTNPWLNPANWAAPLLVVSLGLAFGLKLVVPVAFTAAAPTLMSLAFSFLVITSAMLFLYMVDNAREDWRNQRKSGKLEEYSDMGQPQSEATLRQRYVAGIWPRIKEWWTKHPTQVYFGAFITLLMFTLASLALASILNPIGFDSTVAGHALMTVFNFVAHTLSELSQGIPFLQFEAGSITSNVLVVIVVALLPTFFLNAVRQGVTTGYEKLKDENLSDVEMAMEEKEAPIIDRGVDHVQSQQGDAIQTPIDQTPIDKDFTKVPDDKPNPYEGPFSAIPVVESSDTPSKPLPETGKNEHEKKF